MILLLLRTNSLPKRIQAGPCTEGTGLLYVSYENINMNTSAIIHSLHTLVKRNPTGIILKFERLIHYIYNRSILLSANQ